MTNIRKLLAILTLLFAIAMTAGNVAGADAMCSRFSTEIPVEIEARTCADLP